MVAAEFTDTSTRKSLRLRPGWITFSRGKALRKIKGLQLCPMVPRRRLQPRQTHAVAPVRLDSVACLLRDQRRRHHLAVLLQFQHLPIDTVPAQTRFVTERQSRITFF